jgi:hypothetical protein
MKSSLIPQKPAELFDRIVAFKRRLKRCLWHVRVPKHDDARGDVGNRERCATCFPLVGASSRLRVHSGGIVHRPSFVSEAKRVTSEKSEKI